MTLTLVEEGMKFDFPKAKTLYKFDETHNDSPNYHGVSQLKAVDVVAEFKDFQLWIEIKEFQYSEIEDMRREGDMRKSGNEIHRKSYLTNNFKLKFRDTWLYRWCEDKNQLPIIYICLTNFDSALNVFYKKELVKYLPTGKPNKKENFYGASLVAQW